MSVVTQSVPTGTWAVDPIHSSIEFRVRHIGLSNFKGRFTDVSARLADGRLEGSVPVESVSVNVPDLKGHLLAPDFFDAERSPEISFASEDIEIAGDGSVVAKGELTIKGTTRPVEARGSITEPGVNAAGAEAFGLELETTVDRNEFGVSWNADLPNGKKVLSDDVKLIVELELVRAEA
jgi:polyisoprenoid-binding protein YceI